MAKSISIGVSWSSARSPHRSAHFRVVPGLLPASDLKARLRHTANGLTPRTVLEKFAALQMIDVHLPTTDGREIVMARHTQPEKDLQLLLDQLKLELPEQGPPKIQAQQPAPEPIAK